MGVLHYNVLNGAFYPPSFQRSIFVTAQKLLLTTSLLPDIFQYVFTTSSRVGEALDLSLLGCNNKIFETG